VSQTSQEEERTHRNGSGALLDQPITLTVASAWSDGGVKLAHRLEVNLGNYDDGPSIKHQAPSIAI